MTKKLTNSNALSDQEANRLFHQYLPVQPLPADLSRRLTQRVLSEVTLVQAQKAKTPSAQYKLSGGAKIWRNLQVFFQSLRPAPLGVAGALALLLLVVLLLGPGTVTEPSQTLRRLAATLQGNSGQLVELPVDQVVQLQQGEELVTETNSAIFEPFTGQKVTVAPHSHVQVMALSQEEKQTVVELTLLSGEVACQVHPAPETQTQFRVRTANALVSVKGTEFRVAVDAAGKTHVVTLEGVVMVESGGQVVELPAGAEASIDQAQGIQVLDASVTPEPSPSEQPAVETPTETVTPTATPQTGVNSAASSLTYSGAITGTATEKSGNTGRVTTLPATPTSTAVTPKTSTPHASTTTATPTSTVTPTRGQQQNNSSNDETDDAPTRLPITSTPGSQSGTMNNNNSALSSVLTPAAAGGTSLLTSIRPGTATPVRLTAVPTATPTRQAPTPTATTTASLTPSPSATQTPTKTNTPTRLPTTTATRTPTATAIDTATATRPPTATATDTPVPTDTPAPTDTTTATRPPTATATDTPVPTDTATATRTATATPLPTDTAIATRPPTATPTDTPVPTDTATATPLPSDTPTTEPTATPSPIVTEFALPTDTPIPTETATETPNADATSRTDLTYTPTEQTPDPTPTEAILTERANVAESLSGVPDSTQTPTADVEPTGVETTVEQSN